MKGCNVERQLLVAVWKQHVRIRVFLTCHPYPFCTDFIVRRNRELTKSPRLGNNFAMGK